MGFIQITMKKERKSEPICFRLPEDELRYYKRIAKHRGITITDLITEALHLLYFPKGPEGIEWLDPT